MRVLNWVLLTVWTVMSVGMLGRIITREDEVKNKMTSYGMETAYRDQSFGMPDFSNPFSTP